MAQVRRAHTRRLVGREGGARRRPPRRDGAVPAPATATAQGASIGGQAGPAAAIADAAGRTAAAAAAAGARATLCGGAGYGGAVRPSGPPTHRG
eukprot:5397574-Pleurochrysis_carterae.AAC.1